MEKLQKTHTRWLKISSYNYKNCRWDIFAEEWANFASSSPYSKIQVFVNVHVLRLLYCCCELLWLFLLNWNETMWMMSLLLSLSSYWEDPIQSVSSQSASQSVQALCSIVWCWWLASSVGWCFCSHLMCFNVFRKGCILLETDLFAFYAF
jgi:hypothetical protein